MFHFQITVFSTDLFLLVVSSQMLHKYINSTYPKLNSPPFPYSLAPTESAPPLFSSVSHIILPNHPSEINGSADLFGFLNISLVHFFLSISIVRAHFRASLCLPKIVHESPDWFSTCRLCSLSNNAPLCWQSHLLKHKISTC